MRFRDMCLSKNIAQNMPKVNKFWEYFVQCFSVFIVYSEQVNTSWEGQANWRIYIIFI